MGKKIMPRLVFINGRFLTQPLTGVQRYARELVTALDRLLAEEGRGQHDWALLCPENAEVDLPLRVIRSVTVRGTGNHLWEQGALALAARGGALLSLGNSGAVCHPRQLVIIHDASVFRTPRNYTWRYSVSRRTMTQLLVRTASVGTVSRFSQRELADCLSLSQEEIAVVPNGADHILSRPPDASALSRFGLSAGRYLLCVGSLAPNKNLIRAVEAFQNVADDSHRLIIVGGLAANVFRQALPKSDTQVILAGRVPDEQLVALYRNAAACIFPSLYEGFGIPPLEAMANGCLVLASNIEPVREVCADSAVYFDPLKIDEMAAAIEQALSGNIRRERLIEIGKQRASIYKWSTSAQILWNVVQSILDG
jgi:glycosyltransferase involved in cell wall biosynthesis